MSDSRLVLGSIAFLVTTSVLLTLSGFGTFSYEAPSSPLEDETEEEVSFGGSVVKCVLSLFTSCGEIKQTKVVRGISNVVNFASASVRFLFQLLSFQMPNIPAWLNALIVVPPASIMAFVGIKTIRGAGG